MTITQCMKEHMKNTNKIRSIIDLNFITKHTNKILTLFSGGLDSTFILKELSKHKNVQIVCLTVDLGDVIDKSELKEIAESFGAISVIIDGREEFLNKALLPAIQAQAKYMGMYPISSSLSRPIIAKYAVDYAKKFNCGAIIHTANQSQNSLRRLNGAIEQLGFVGYYGTPYEFSALTREEKIEQLKKLGLKKFQARGISGDSNLWCREFESGSLDNPEYFKVTDELFVWTAPYKTANDIKTEIFSITFNNGIPVAINKKQLPLLDLIQQTNEKVGEFQIGRYAGLEHLEYGEKVLEVREAPAAYIIMDAYRQLETAVLSAELIKEKISLEQLWVREAIEGRWYQTLKEAAQHFISFTSSKITGTVKYNLRPGSAEVFSITADNPKYLTDRDSWEKKVAKVRGNRDLELLINT